jgi:hypothetical protein
MRTLVAVIATIVLTAAAVIPAHASSSDPLTNICPFPITIDQQGKAREIDLPGGRVIYTSPGLKVTITNFSDPTKAITLVATGAFHVTTAANGNATWISTGRSILLDPDAGFVLAIGNFTFVLDEKGNPVQPLAGTGQLIDICTLID